MSYSQKHIISVPRGITSKPNIRKSIESMSKNSFQLFSSPTEKVPLKFKQLKSHGSSPIEQNSQINQLETKYNVYKHGSPNFYSNTIQTHKVNILKNDIKTLDLPFIYRVIKQMKNTESKENSLNSRDFKLYPNSGKSQLSHKFKDLLSDKQELKDFLHWLNSSISLIQEKDASEIKKFQEKQIIISSGFSQIIQQFSKISKTRSQILKQLWNKQAQQMQQIAQHLTVKIIEMQKSHLIESTRTHETYQRQIDILKQKNEQLSQKLKRQTFLNEGYVNTFRVNRKMIKKQQYGLKKLMNFNAAIIKENTSLIEINTELILNESRTNQINKTQQIQTFQTTKNLNFLQQKTQPKQFSPVKNEQQLKQSQAKMILYRKLQQNSQTKQQNLQHNLNKIKNSLIKKIKQNSLNQVNSAKISQYKLQQKKQSLYHYLMKRFEQHPNEKLMIGDDFLHQDDHETKIDEIQSAIKQIINSKNIESYLRKQVITNIVTNKLKEI